MRVNHCLPHWVLVAATTASLTVEAAEWAARPSISVGGEYNDNYRLTGAPHDDVWGVIADPRLKLSRRSELWDVNASGRVRAARYTGEDGLNTVDNYFDIATKRNLERGALEGKLSLVNDTTLQNQFLDVDTGLTTAQIDRAQRSARLAGNYLFTEATWVEASASYTQQSYDNGERYGLRDYDYLTPSLRLIHQYTPQTQVFAVLSHSKVEYDVAAPQQLESKTNSLQLGAAYDITERWKVSGSVGTRRTTSSAVTVQTIVIPFFGPISRLVSSKDESTGLVYDASVTRELETGSVSLTASQSVTPSSAGRDTESTRISLNGTHNISAKLSAALAVSFYRTTSVGDTTTVADTDRYRITPSLTWRLDENLALNAGYIHTRVERSPGQTVDSNAVYATLGYSWPPLAVSR